MAVQRQEIGQHGAIGAGGDHAAFVGGHEAGQVKNGKITIPGQLFEQALHGPLFGIPQTGRQAQKTRLAATEFFRIQDLHADTVDVIILVSEPGKGSPEVRITLGQGPLSGAELCLARAQDGQLFIRLACADPASFQTAVGAQDALRSALERSGENVRVEIVQSRADGGNEGDARQQSRGRQDYVPDVE